MKTSLFSLSVALLSSFAWGAEQNPAGNRKTVIAHRGASGYLPEHTLEAKALAFQMGADYLEQDVVMTKDDKLVVLHGYYLDNTSNVADVYPDRKRKNGRYYSIDFTLAELRKLQMTSEFKTKNGKRVPVYPKRFPLFKSTFRIHTLQEELEFIQGLNFSTGKNIGIYPEIKSPAFFRHEGKDISKAVLEVLKQYGYDSKDDPVYLQCFDAEELQRIHGELLPEMGMDLKLIQLIPERKWKLKDVYHKDGTSSRYDSSWMFTPEGIKKMATYADGISPSIFTLVDPKSKRGHLKISPMVKEAHEAGMIVHPYTFRVERVPPYADSLEEMFDIYFNQVGIDGAFTDFPDRMVDFLRQ